MLRRVLQLIVAVTLSALPLVVAVAPARADNASALLGLVNSLRAAHGVGPLYADPALTAVAAGWSAHMASGYGLGHNPNVGSQVGGGWTKLGENVGEGGNINAIFNAFVNSSFHLGNMLDPTYNLTGIGVAVGRLNTLWVTQDFEAKPGATPVTTRPPATAPTTKAPASATPTTKAPAPPTSPPAPVPTPPATPATTSLPATPLTIAPAAATTPDPALALPTDAAPANGPASIAPAHDTSRGKLAAASSAASGGGSPSTWVVAFAASVIVLLAGTAIFVKRLLR